jgi:T4 RnlA family RNA ligase
MDLSLRILNKYRNEGLLYSQVHPTLPLTIWNYTEKVQYEGLWDEVTLSCRGLVTDDRAVVFARPFKKFFNMEEGKHTSTSEFEVFEKMDGSLGIMFKYNGEVICATRGSFASDQAVWMSKFAKEYNYQDIIVDGFTYLFEIIYPENRIVVNYGDQERLVLLGIIKTESGEEVPYDDISFDGWDIVNKYDGIRDYSELKSKIDNNAEGFVVRFSNGDRMKIKGEEYLRLHKVMTNLSTTAVWEVLSNGGSMDDLLKDVPDEFYGKVKEYEKSLIVQFNQLEEEYQNHFDSIKGLGVRKLFAQTAIMFQHPSILFGMLDGKDISPMIWKIIKPEFKKL